MTDLQKTPSLTRRDVLKRLGIGAAGLGAATLLNNPLFAASGPGQDVAVLNFALNLEYLEAEYYLRAAYGRGLRDADITGSGELGPVVGGRKVAFATSSIQQYAAEIARDEEAHVKFLRTALDGRAVARPAINLQEAFTAAAVAAGVIQQGQAFNPFADEASFLLGAFLFEDVGVTAYAGAAPLLLDPNVLAGAAGLLAVEAYHAANVRTTLFALGEAATGPAGQISDARDSLDGADDADQGLLDANGMANIVPTDENGLVFVRTPMQVLNIVYLNPNAQPGGFFPQGVNGTIK